MANAAGSAAGRVPKILFFISDMVPTDAEREQAERFKGANVAFRNSRAVSTSTASAMEECDAVAGAVPDRYAAVFPNVDSIGSERLNRMSDYDLPHGSVTDLNNEAARAAKPPAIGAVNELASGATRTPGAMTQANGGFVAPAPQSPRELPMFGSERAENAAEGSTVTPPGTPTATNPHGLPPGGVTAAQGGTGPATGANGGENIGDGATGGTGAPTGAVSTGAVASDPPGSGFTAPEPAKPDADADTSKDGKKAAEKKSGGKS